jgi:predicted transcriptional regulator
VRIRLVSIDRYQECGSENLEERFMIAAVSVISVVLGAAIAYVADRYPAHVEALETSAGVLLIGGFALLGSSLPAVL